MSLKETLLRRQSSIRLLECFECSHPDFSKTHRFVRNALNGVTVKHEDGQSYTYNFVPVQIERASNSDDLDQSFNFTLSLLGSDFEDEIENLDSDKKPIVTYRVYRHDDLENALTVINELAVEKLSTDAEGVSTFTASAARLNSVGTGTAYTFERFPGLKGFV